MNDPLNWLLFIFVNGLALYASRSLTAFLNRSDRSFALSLVTTGVIYLAQITLLVIILGAVFQHLDRTTLMACSVGLSTILITAFRRRRRPFLADLRYAWKGLSRDSDTFLKILSLLFVIQAVLLLAKAAWIPPHIWDVFYYHLAPAVEWYQQGMIPLAIDTPAQHMNRVPLGMSVLSYWFFIFFEDDLLVNLPQTLWALMIAPLTYSLLRLGQVNRSWSAKFAIATFFIPFVLMQAITSKDHLGLTVSFLTGVLMLASYLQRHDSRLLVTAGLAFGLTLGYKSASLAMLAVTLAFFLIFLFARRREILAIEAKRRALITSAGIGSLLALMIGGFWYLRRLLTGSVTTPLPPARSIAEATAGGGGEAARFSLAAIQHNVQEFIYRIFDLRGAYTADLIGISGFGPQFVSFGLIALFGASLAIFLRRSYRRPEFLFIVTVTVLFVLFLISNYSANINSYRILIFMPIVMIAYACIMLFRRGWLRVPAIAFGVNLLLLVCVVWDLLVTLPPPLTNQREFKAFITAPAAYQTSGTYNQWFSLQRPDFHRLLDALPTSTVIAIVSPPQFNQLFRKGQAETWSYPYYDRHWQRHLAYFKDRGDLRCDAARLVCQPTDQFKAGLLKANIQLVSSCPTNRCVGLQDPDFFEITPGFYYFNGKPTP